MKLKLDTDKTYAIALEGGGAKGAYEIGAWIAFKECGIKFNAVSGTSVGALNGALMVMGDIDRAVKVWKDIRLSQVIQVSAEEEKDLKKVLSGDVEFSDIDELIPQALDIIKNRGLDVTPLRQWIKEMVDEKALKESPVELYVTTVSLSELKPLEIKINDLPTEEICDMLLASAYHPTFRLEKLGGKLYADGGLMDTLPLHALVSRGYKDIIAVRIPGHGRERRFKMPDDVNLTVIDTEFDLGGVLNFDAQQARRDMSIGYYDTMRVLFGLYGRRFCIERTMSEREALAALIDRLYDEESEFGLRALCEKELPRIAKKLDAEKESYYDILIKLMEREAELLNIEPLNIYTDRELLFLIEEAEGEDGGIDVFEL